MYKLQPNDWRGNPAQMIFDVTNSCWIPIDPDNTDAQAFAKWLKDGGTPEPAEEGGSVSAEWIAETIAKLLPAEEQ